MTLVRLDLRRHRRTIAVWWVVLVALVGATVGQYSATYPTAAERHAATVVSQQNVALTLLYGTLPDAGTPAQMFAWEMGAILTLLVAVMAILLSVTLVRSTEDDGTLDIVRAAGLRPSAPFAAAITVIVLTAAALAAGCTVAVGAHAGSVDSVTWSGAVLFGAVIGTTFLTVCGIGSLAAQVAPNSGDARLLGFAAVAVAFGVRAVGDIRDIGWLAWVDPLALRATVSPFDRERWAALGIPVLASAGLVWACLAVSRRREVGAGLLRPGGRSDARLPISTTLGLAVRLERRSVIVWVGSLACFGALFAAMGSGVVTTSADGDLGDGFLAAQMGGGDPVAGYFSYTGTFLAILVSVYAVTTVLRAARDETSGLTVNVLTAGIHRSRPLASQLAMAATGTGAALLATGCLVALVAPHVVTGDQVALTGFGYVVGQFPSVLVLASLAALVAGSTPRHTSLAWIPLGFSALVALLGVLLGIPEGIRELGAFQHTPNIAAADPDLGPLLGLVALSGIASTLGLVAVRHRDMDV
jgi:ABC-2 type transport system permease protein